MMRPSALTFRSDRRRFALFWALAIAGFIAAALAYAYWVHRSDSRRLTALLTPFARRHDGELRPASLLYLPQLRFEQKGRRFLVMAMPNSGFGPAGGSAHGPFTFTDLELPYDIGYQVRIQRGDPKLTSNGVRILDPFTKVSRPETGDAAFDEAFRITGTGQVFAARLLDPDLRARLLASGLPRLELRLEGTQISVHMDGIARSEAEIAELIEIAGLLADRCTEAA